MTEKEEKMPGAAAPGSRKFVLKAPPVRIPEKYKKEIDAQFVEQESRPYPLEDCFRHLYTEMPDHLKRQMVDYQKFLNWKESQR